METPKTFKLDQNLLERIYSYYKECLKLENSEKSTEFNVPLLSDRSFESLLQTAFWASLTREEGLFHNFSLSIFPTPSNETQKYAESYIFETSLPFSPKNLAKISGAFESTNNQIGIWLNENDETFDIWGFTEHTNSFFEIKSFDAGQLIISFPWGLHSRNPKKLFNDRHRFKIFSKSAYGKASEIFITKTRITKRLL